MGYCHCVHVRIDLPPMATSPHAARLRVSDVLRVWGCREALDVADVIVSELVTNAVEHAGTDITLELELRPPHVRVRVTDLSGDCPLPVTPPSSTNERGRGLAIVDALAQGWGYEDAGHSKTVWVDLPAT